MCDTNNFILIWMQYGSMKVSKMGYMRRIWWQTMATQHTGLRILGSMTFNQNSGLVNSTEKCFLNLELYSHQTFFPFFHILISMYNLSWVLFSTNDVMLKAYNKWNDSLWQCFQSYTIKQLIWQPFHLRKFASSVFQQSESCTAMLTLESSHQ